MIKVKKSKVKREINSVTRGKLMDIVLELYEEINVPRAREKLNIDKIHQLANDLRTALK